MQPHDEDPYWDTIGKSRAELEAECDSTDASVATVLVRIIVLLGLACLFVWCSNAHAQSGGDANGDGSVTISDVVDLVRYIFEGVELPRTEWVEPDTISTTVWIGDRAYDLARWPITVQTHYYVVDSDTAWVREVIIANAQDIDGGELLVVR